MVSSGFYTRARRLVKSGYARVTLSGVTLWFFLLSVSFCILQILFQGFLWNGDAIATRTLDGILVNTDVPTTLLRWLTVRGDDYHLRVCTEAPLGVTNVSHICPTIFDSLGVAQDDWVAPRNIRKHGFHHNQSAPLILQVGMQDGESSIEITEQCMYTLLYPMQRMRNSASEELVLMFSQIWLLGISSSAVLNQSIPHLLAVFAMRMLATGWSAYTIWRTQDLKSRLWHIVMAPNTPCHTDFEFLPGYFKTRFALQIPDVTLNVVALLFTGILGWSMIKSFSHNIFNCVGPPARIVRLYGYMLTVFVCGQLLSFLTTTSISLALQEGLTHTRLVGVQVALFVLAFILTLLMIPLGYYATRKERRLPMAVFIIILVGFIALFLSLFSSGAFRFSWLQWPFFASVTGVNCAVLICCTVFAILCRTHFGEGLSHYLHVEEVLSEQNFAADDFSTEDPKERKKDERDWDFVDRASPSSRTVKFNVNGRVDP